MTRRSAITPPPAGLGEAGAALWRTTLAEYELSGPEQAVLALACQAADRAAEARAAIDASGGVVVTGRYGPRLNPGVAAEKDARAAVLVNLRALGVVNAPELSTRDRSTPGPKPSVRR